MSNTMRRAIRRSICCVYARGVPFSPPLQTLRCPLPARLAYLIPPQLRVYSSGNDKCNELNSAIDHKKDSSIGDDVSTEELKRKIDTFYGGDVESLPSIFEAILKRKLSGKHEEADDELMNELRQRSPGQVEDFVDSDLDEIQETDEDMEDSSDVEENDRKT